MTKEQAKEIALSSRQRYHAIGFRFGSAEKRFIRIVESPETTTGRPAGPGPVRELIAWVVRISGQGGWIEFAIDDISGNIVRVRRSRGIWLGHE